MTAPIRIDNIDKLQQQLRRMPVKTLAAVRVAVNEEAESIRGKSLNLVPVGDTVALKNSITVTPAVVKGRTVVGFVGAGGAAIDYAEAVHETPSKHDPPSWVGKTVKFRIGGPKFIEKPANEAKKGFERRIWRRVERQLR